MGISPSPPAKIDLRHVTHLYVTSTQAYLAIQGIDLQVKEGELLCLVGPSGCGKTTILSLIAGLEKPTAGKVMIDGEPVEGPSRKVGYMLQHDYLFNWRTIEDNVMLGLEIQRMRTRETEEYAMHLLEEMGLIEHRHSYPNQLSGGMRQRVALVRTLACQPDILLLDEPFSSLDYQTKLRLEDLVVDTLRRQRPVKTTVLVTHDLSEAAAMADRLIVMDSNPGRIKREIDIPAHIRDPLPFEARNQADFAQLFQLVWRELEVDKDGTH